MSLRNGLNDFRNLKSLCRVCLTEGQDMISLHAKEECNPKVKNSVISDILGYVANGKLNRDSRYPSLICGMCLGLLKICYKFLLQFNESQDMLLEYHGDSKNKNKCFDTLMQKDYMVPPVELISDRGIFDLKDVLVIESEKIKQCNYNGFLQNLGSEISATFVGQAKFIDPPNVEQEFSTTKVLPLSQLDDKTKVALNLVCKRRTYRKFLKRHSNIDIVNNTETFVCEFCGILSTHSNHCDHMIKGNSKKHCCELCKKSYCNSSHLRLHIEAVHMDSRLYLCPICGKSFNYNTALTYHMRLHTGERKYICTYCDRKFTMQCSLKRHLLAHTGIRPYKCHYCDKAFRSTGEVACHEMAHTGFRPYHCKYCQKGFTKTYNLNVHLMSHEGPHVCDVCNKNFIEIQYLKAHIKNVHGHIETEGSAI